MSIIKQIQAAGIVGCGGAGFPTHVKLSGEIEHLILNGAECEPMLRTDRYVMKHHAQEIVTAAAGVMAEIEAQRCTIALKETYGEEIGALESEIARQGAAIALHKMKSFYPAGDEQVIVAEVTGRAIPPGGIPLDVGCAVSNVTTMFHIAGAMKEEVFTHKYLTVAGMVETPCVIRVPIGTSFARCLALAGGVPEGEWMAVSGGPMMGKRLSKAQALASYVTKTTSGILIFPPDNPLAQREEISLPHMYSRARSACIQCRYCTDLCPRNLLGHPLEPHRIMRQMAYGLGGETPVDEAVVRSAALCSECGVCELYACPMGLQPRRVNQMLKQELAKKNLRWGKGEGAREPSPWRAQRQVPTHRAAVRAGAGAFYESCPTDHALQDTPDKVVLYLRQHVGAPACPVVAVGETVAAGQLVAAAAEQGLSANLHASISGRVTDISQETMTIEGEGAKG